MWQTMLFTADLLRVHLCAILTESSALLTSQKRERKTGNVITDWLESVTNNFSANLGTFYKCKKYFLLVYSQKKMKYKSILYIPAWSLFFFPLWLHSFSLHWTHSFLIRRIVSFSLSCLSLITHPLLKKAVSAVLALFNTAGHFLYEHLLPPSLVGPHVAFVFHCLCICV